MSISAPRVLMITPFHRQQRGNSVTSARLKNGLESRGFGIDLLSLEESHAFSQLGMCLDLKQYALVHALHARHLAQALEEIPRLYELPIILTTTGTDLHFDMHGTECSRVEKAFQAASKIVVFHKDFVELIAGTYPELKHKLVAIPQGVFLPLGLPCTRQQLGLSDKDFVFLLPSGLRPVKNIALAIDAMEKVQPDYPNLRLLIMGADLNPDYSRPILEHIKNRSWIKYLGEIPHDQIRSLMMQADVVINTSQAEGQPQAALEAMSLGKPCILTAVPGNSNIIEPGKEGYYVCNEEDLIQAAKTLINNPDMAKKMGLAAHHLVTDKYRLEQELDAYTALYHHLLK